MAAIAAKERLRLVRVKYSHSLRQKIVIKNAPRSLREKKPEPRSPERPNVRGGIALVPLPFVSPTHSRAPSKNATSTTDESLFLALRAGSNTPPFPQYFCAGLDLAYDEGSMANFSHLGTYARLEKLS